MEISSREWKSSIESSWRLGWQFCIYNMCSEFFSLIKHLTSLIVCPLWRISWTMVLLPKPCAFYQWHKIYQCNKNAVTAPGYVNTRWILLSSFRLKIMSNNAQLDLQPAPLQTWAWPLLACPHCDTDLHSSNNLIVIHKCLPGHSREE